MKTGGADAVCILKDHWQEGGEQIVRGAELKEEAQLVGQCSNACEICGGPKLMEPTVRMEISTQICDMSKWNRRDLDAV